MLKDTVDGEFTTVDDVAADGAVLRRLPDQRADRPVARRQPRLVHAVRRAARAASRAPRRRPRCCSSAWATSAARRRRKACFARRWSARDCSDHVSIDSAGHRRLACRPAAGQPRDRARAPPRLRPLMPARAPGRARGLQAFRLDPRDGSWQPARPEGASTADVHGSPRACSSTLRPNWAGARSPIPISGARRASRRSSS